MSKTNPKVDFYFTKAKQWKDEFTLLRKIILACGLAEELKWGCAAYTLDGTNIVLIHGFKEYCALLFFKGALMKDAKGLLIQQTENVQAARQLRFTELKEIKKLENVIKAYVRNAVEVEKSGAKVEKKATKDFPVPEEFQIQLDEIPELKKAFAALTPGRQRAYLLHFAGAKQSATRTARVEKNMQQILAGKGLDDD
ncbi:YdeI family protein [soil metagenome]